jgi:preprotein translocase subunit YajC
MNMTIDFGPAFLLLQGGSLISILPMWILIFAIFYLLVIRPQQKRTRLAAQERESLLKGLKTGDKVITSSGIYGTIVAVRDKEDTVLIRIAPSVSIEMLRSSIAGLQSSEVKEVKEVEATK